MVYFLFAPDFLSQTLCAVLVAMIFSDIQLGQGRNATEPQPLQTRVDLNGNVSATPLLKSVEHTHTHARTHVHPVENRGENELQH